MTRRCCRRAFSQAEIGVLAILIAITFAFLAPAILRGRIQAQRQECKPVHTGMFDEVKDTPLPEITYPGNDWEEEYWLPPLNKTGLSDDGSLARQALAWLADSNAKADDSAPVRIIRGCNHKFHPNGRCGGRPLPFDKTRAGLSPNRPFLP